MSVRLLLLLLLLHLGALHLLPSLLESQQPRLNVGVDASQVLVAGTVAIHAGNLEKRTTPNKTRQDNNSRALTNMPIFQSIN